MLDTSVADNAYFHWRFERYNIVVDDDRLRNLVEKYCQERRHPELPPFNIFAHSIDSWWSTPESGRPGCYIYYSESGEALYAGKASFKKRIGDRLFAHDHAKKKSWWREKAHHLRLVTVSEPFEASSLEEFLLYDLCPIGNVVGRRLKADPDDDDSDV